MSNFLKIGNAQQNFETDKALRQTGDFDVNGGEVVEVSFDANQEATGSHRIASPVGAIPIDRQLTGNAHINWTSGPNTLTVTSNTNVSGTMKFLVF